MSIQVGQRTHRTIGRTEKVCGRCKETKPVADFHQRRLPSGTMGLHSYCKPCNKSHTREWHYGLSQGQYEEMLAAQGGVCAMCGAEPTQTAHGTLSLHVDHDHGTKKVRALLCHACNNGLGCFGDSIDRLEKAIAYLRTHGGVPST